MCGIHIDVSYLRVGLSLALPLFERRSVLRRILLVLTVAALMAAMMVSAGPAQANEIDFGNSTNLVAGDGFIGFGVDDDIDGIDFDDIFGFGRHFGHHGIDDDIDGNDGIIFGGIDQRSDSGELSIGSDVS